MTFDQKTIRDIYFDHFNTYHSLSVTKSSSSDSHNLYLRWNFDKDTLLTQLTGKPFIQMITTDPEHFVLVYTQWHKKIQLRSDINRALHTLNSLNCIGGPSKLFLNEKNGRMYSVFEGFYQQPSHLSRRSLLKVCQFMLQQCESFTIKMKQ
jgi:hypothetical protein